MLYSHTYNVHRHLFSHPFPKLPPPTLCVLNYLEYSGQGVLVCQVRSLCVNPKLLPVFLTWLLKQSIILSIPYLGEEMNYKLTIEKSMELLKSEDDDLFSVFLQIVQKWPFH